VEKEADGAREARAALEALAKTVAEQLAYMVGSTPNDSAN
jgi:hypothetical protein